LEKNLDKIEIINTGNSHAYSAIDPQVWNYRGFNLANVDQDLYYDSELLNAYLDRMPQLKLAIIPISYLTLEFKLEDSPEEWRRFFYARVYGLPCRRQSTLFSAFDIRSYSMIALYSPNEAQSFAQKMFAVNLAEDVDNNGFFAIEATNYASIGDQSGKERVEIHHHSMRPENIAENIAILRNMITRLKARNVKVALITIPVLPTYSKFIFKSKYDEMQMNIKKIVDEFGCQYFNYLYDRRFTDNDFLNNDHLNRLGAEKFSKIIAADFIDRYMKAAIQ
jgi:hypothetical protein